MSSSSAYVHVKLPHISKTIADNGLLFKIVIGGLVLFLKAKGRSPKHKISEATPAVGEIRLFLPSCGLLETLQSTTIPSVNPYKV